MTNHEIIDNLLQINKPGIAEAIIEVFGEKFRDVIYKRMDNITFFLRGQNSLIIDYIDMSIANIDSENFETIPQSIKKRKKRNSFKNKKSNIT